MKNIFVFTFILSMILVSGCTFTEKVKDGRTAFERKQYAVAIPMLEKALRKAKAKKEKGELAYMIGESYTKTNQHEKALVFYAQAVDNQVNTDYLKALAFAQKHDEQYKEAVQTLKNLSTEIGSIYEYKKDITACQTAQQWVQNIVNTGVSVKNLPLNSANSEYAPFVIGNQIVFTSDRPNTNSPKPYKWTGRSFSDIYTVNKNNYEAVSAWDNDINSAWNDGTMTFSADGNELFFSRSSGEGREDYFCKLFTSKKENGKWTIPSALAFCKDNVNYAHPCLGINDNVLFFSSDDPDAIGGYDIFYTSRTQKGWDDPKPLPKVINTDGNEEFPFMDADTLYFASDKHFGMGGLDIFKTWRVGKDNWITPQNLKAPINSGADDFALIVDNTLKTNVILRGGYFSSNRKGGFGQDDIYQFVMQKPIEKPKPIDTVKVVKVINYKLILDINVLEKIYQETDNPNSKVLGRKPLEGVTLTMLVNGKSTVLKPNIDGVFQLELTENTDYQFVASLNNYLTNDVKFTTRGIGRDANNPIQSFETEVVLEKIFRNKEITLDNIYYDYDQWYIRDDAKPTLDNLSKILNQNPNVKIQLSSHTDCRGNDAYNLDLSQKRAQAAVDYLITRGVNAERLFAKGYGETIPALSCVCSKCTETENQINRRTTFTIVE